MFYDWPNYRRKSKDRYWNISIGLQIVDLRYNQEKNKHIKPVPNYFLTKLDRTEYEEWWDRNYEDRKWAEDNWG